MEIISTPAPLRSLLRAAKGRDQTIAFVPTMGALHDGHRSCIEIARKLGDLVVVSIFVNPTQFGATEDFDSYPIAMDDDLRLCEEWGCDVVFNPMFQQMYPKDQQVWIDVGPISEPLCGRTRVGHFRGVVTVVAKTAPSAIRSRTESNNIGLLSHSSKSNNRAKGFATVSPPLWQYI